MFLKYGTSPKCGCKDAGHQLRILNLVLKHRNQRKGDQNPSCRTTSFLYLQTMVHEDEELPAIWTITAVVDPSTL